MYVILSFNLFSDSFDKFEWTLNIEAQNAVILSLDFFVRMDAFVISFTVSGFLRLERMTSFLALLLMLAVNNLLFHKQDVCAPRNILVHLILYYALTRSYIVLTFKAAAQISTDAWVKTTINQRCQV